MNTVRDRDQTAVTGAGKVGMAAAERLRFALRSSAF
jgi:hypothetical protein